MRIHFILALMLYQMGCSTEPPEPEMLVNHELWVETDPSDDPFSDRPEKIDCNPLAYGHEFIGEHSFEVETQNCDYITARQPSLTDVEVGDELKFRLWHNALVGPEGESHISVMLVDTVLWDLHLAIPGESGLLSDVFISEVDAPAGSDIFFHLHNHGANTYNFIDFSVTDL
jgi:hypothetical protein